MPQETIEWWKGIGEELEIDIEVVESSQVDRLNIKDKANYQGISDQRQQQR